MELEKQCKICGNTFLTKSPRSLYCKKPITLKCSVCGQEYEGLCQPSNPTTCPNPDCKRRAGYVGQLKKLEKRICKICGQEFMPTTLNQFTCNRKIKKICVICSKEFEDICAPWHEGKTCSDECMHRLQDEGKKAYWQNLTRRCKWCGKEFHPTTNTAAYCEGPHYKQCKICGKMFEIDASNGDDRLRTVCSDSCKAEVSRRIFKDPEVQAKARKAMKERYGAQYPAQVPEFLEKQRKTTFDRYGVEFFTQLTEAYKERAIKTNLERYGTEWATQSEAIQSKIKQTNMEKFGALNYMQSVDMNW